MDKELPILVRLFKEESELEVWKQDREGRFALLEDLSDLPLVRRARPQDQGRRPPGAGGLLQHHPRPDESELAILPVVRSRLSERLRPRPRPHRRAAHGARRLLVARLLFDDRRADLGNLRARPRLLLRRPEIVPGAGLSVPDDGAELRQASQQPASGVLEDAEEGQRSFRGQQARAQGQCLRQALRVRRRSRPVARALSFSPAAKCPAYEVPEEIASLVRDKERQDEHPVRRSEPPQHRDRADQDQRRRRHASGVRRSREEEPDRRRAAGTELPGVHARPEPFRSTVRPPRIPELASAPVRRAAPRWTPAIAARSRRPRWRLPRPSPPRSRRPGRAAAACSAACSRPSRPKQSRRHERQHDRSHGAPGRPARQRQGRQDVEATPAPKPKPVAKPTSVASHGAIRTKQAEAEPIKTTEAQAPARPAAAAPAPAPAAGAGQLRR